MKSGTEFVSGAVNHTPSEGVSDIKQKRKLDTATISATAAVIAACAAISAPIYGNHALEKANARQELFERQVVACTDWMDGIEKLQRYLITLGEPGSPMLGPESLNDQTQQELEDAFSETTHQLNVIALVFPPAISAKANSLQLDIRNFRAITVGGRGDRSALSVNKLQARILNGQADVYGACIEHAHNYADLK